MKGDREERERERLDYSTTSKDKTGQAERNKTKRSEHQEKKTLTSYSSEKNVAAVSQTLILPRSYL